MTTGGQLQTSRSKLYTRALAEFVDRHDEIHVAGHRRLSRPVADSDAADRARVQFGAFQGIDY